MTNGKHNCGSDAFKIALTAAANPPVNTNTILANLTEISYTNLSARALTTTSNVQTAGVDNFIIADLVLTASGAVAAFQYAVVWNDTPTSPVDPLVCWFDYGTPITMANADTVTLDFDNVNGLFSLS